MKLAFKTKKSGGMRVEPRVHRIIKRGDVARDREMWAEAAAEYRAALAIDPGLPHIYVQLGHVLKEARAIEEADAAYAAAARLRPDDPEPLLLRANLAKRFDTPAMAASLFAAALRRQKHSAEALRELTTLLGPLHAPLSDEQLDFLIEHRGSASAATAVSPRALSGDRRPLVFDLTDLIGHFRHHRLPNGIQRVQSEVLAALLDQRAPGEIAACCFASGRDGWAEVPLALCRDLIRLASTSGDVAEPVWQAARMRLFLHLALADRYVLPWRAVLVNLGVSVWVHDYYRFIRNAKAERQISYIPLVYDMIPIVKPEYCVRGWIKDMTIWVVGLFQHADGFLAISQSAKHDLLQVAERLGHYVGAEQIEVVPLDADFRRAGVPLPSASLDRWNLGGMTFALLVSTIEPRKNHALAFDAWADLLHRFGAAVVPRLVCVGRDGWMNDAVFDRLDTDPLLAAHVTLIEQASDAELALLYRESLFTLFPSLYEGWGLPVTESLCHGRVPVIADNSSLPEAGAGLALPFTSGSIPALVGAIEKVAFDTSWRIAREAEIAASFKPRAWAQVADQIESAQARLLAATSSDCAPPLAQRELYYPIGLYRGPGLWRGLASGEIFRSGDDWVWPEPAGCRTKPDGGLLRMRIAGADALPLRFYIQVRGLAVSNCPVTISMNGTPIGAHTVRRAKESWIACDLPPQAEPELEILVRGALSETVTMSAGGVDKAYEVSVAVVGFFFCYRDDEAANTAFIRARRGNLAAISAYRRVTEVDHDRTSQSP